MFFTLLVGIMIGTLLSTPIMKAGSSIFFYANEERLTYEQEGTEGASY